jgi:branched-chain amino acid transport system substrate-binding protein
LEAPANPEVKVPYLTARRIFAFYSAAMLVGVLTGCQQSPPAGDAGHSELSIVPVSQIDQDGATTSTKSNAAPADPAGDGKAACPPVSVAMAGPITGADAALGMNIRDGAQLAVDQHNANNPGCRVELKAFDTEGDPEKAIAAAAQIIDNPSIIGLIGPGNSGETKATGPALDQAGLAALTPSATNVSLTKNGWRTFFRGLANDAVQGPSIAHYLTKTLGKKRVCVVDDSTDYGLGLADAVRQTLGTAGPPCNIEVKRGDKDFSAAVTQLKNSAPDAVFYGGFYTEAAELTTQLRDAGVSATFASGDAANDAEYVKLAGDASKGALLSCPCAPASGAFADAYAKKFGRPPGTYSTESYDLATVVLKGIDSGHLTRPALLDFVRNYRGQGVARSYQWTATGELSNDLIWMYKVQ